MRIGFLRGLLERRLGRSLVLVAKIELAQQQVCLAFLGDAACNAFLQDVACLRPFGLRTQDLRTQVVDVAICGQW